MAGKRKGVGEGAWRGGMERGDGSKSDAERLQSGVVVVMEEV